MRCKSLILLFALILVPAVYSATPALEGICVSEFKGSATMGHKFTGAVTSETFKVTFREVESKTLADFAVTSSFAKLTTFHVKRDREMREHFDAEKNPDITGTVKALDWAAVKATTGAARTEIPFTFAFAGGKADMKAVARDYREESDGTVRFDVEFEVSQKACGCKPITMMAVMKVHDPVPVTAHVILKPAKP